MRLTPVSAGVGVVFAMTTTSVVSTDDNTGRPAYV